MGVAGEDEVDGVTARVSGDRGGIVGLMRHEQNRRIRVGRDGEIEVGAAEGDVVNAAKENVCVTVVDANVLIDEDGKAVGLEVVADDAGADDGVMVAENAEAEGAGKSAEDFRAAGGGGEGDIDRHGAAAGVVAGDEEEVGLEGVDLVEDATEKKVFGVLLEVDVGNLNEAEAIESRGKGGEEEGAGENLALVPRPLVGIEADSGDGSEGAGKEGAAGEQAWRSRLVKLGNAGHRSS